MNTYFFNTDTVPGKAEDKVLLVDNKSLFVKAARRKAVEPTQQGVFQCLLKIEMILTLVNSRN